MRPVFDMLIRHVPPARCVDVVEWARVNVRLPGSARAEEFDPMITPWTREPITRIDDGVTKRTTFVKPVQAGGSVVGEIAVAYWISQKAGDVQYNWQNDDNADERYEKRIERILRACRPVMAKWPEDRHKAKKGLVIFPHCNLMVQGVFTDRRVASDSVKYQVNEEVHDEEGWKPGQLSKAFGRLTAYWDSVSFVISNAGRKNSELHKEFDSGSCQRWEVRCPGCGRFHTMRTRWEDQKPELGGLRYDSDGCKRESGGFDYGKLVGTLRYQMPCGYSVPEDVAARRALSLSGRYGDPTNPGAPKNRRSYTLEAVSVDYIPWIDLVMQKHEALRALKYGDPDPWKTYLRERECIFADDSDRPTVGKIILSSVKKDRAGLDGRMARFAAVDRQQGSLVKGEVPHWWVVIRDVMPNSDSRLVFEGKILTDEDVADVMQRHEVCPRHVVADSGDDTTHVYQFCLRYGYNAIKGADQPWFTHEEEDTSDPTGRRKVKFRKIYSPEKPLHGMLNAPPTQENKLDEPQFWLYSKAGIRDRLHWLRSSKSIKWEVPGDASQDYIAHMESEVLEDDRDSRGYEVKVWKQIRERNDLFVCECYVAMLMDMAGLIGNTQDTTK